MAGNSPDRSRKSPAQPMVGQSLGLSSPALDEAIQLRLGDFLARRADPLVGELAPDAFLLLLARMEEEERGE
jgi:hypothetical protein